MPPPRRVTMQDVVRACGVSRQVVSAVLNGRESGSVRYSAETRERVLSAAERLGYRPNRASLGLIDRQHRSIGLLADKLSNVDLTTLQGILTTARNHDLLVTIERFHRDGEPLPILVREHAVDGLIAIEDVPVAVEQAIERLGIPTLWLNTNRTGGSGVITFDEIGAMDLVAGHLAERGWRHPALLHAPQTRHYSGADRRRGLEDACARHGLAAPLLIPPPQRPEASWGEQMDDLADAIGEALRSHPTIDAVVLNALLAAPAYRAAQRCGRRVGEDLAVVGLREFGMPYQIEPRLTTVSLQDYGIGVRTVEMLRRLVAGEDPGTERLQYELQVRESS